MAWKGNSESYTRKIITALPLYNTVTLEKCGHIFYILLFGFFWIEGCSCYTNLILVIVGDSPLARISPGANLHRSPKTASASLVRSGWKSSFFINYPVLILQSDWQGCCLWGPPHLHGSVSRGGTQLAGCVLGPWALPHPRGSAWLGTAAWVVSSSEVFLAFCCKAALFLLLFTL